MNPSEDVRENQMIGKHNLILRFLITIKSYRRFGVRIFISFVMLILFSELSVIPLSFASSIECPLYSQHTIAKQRKSYYEASDMGYMGAGLVDNVDKNFTLRTFAWFDLSSLPSGSCIELVTFAYKDLSSDSNNARNNGLLLFSVPWAYGYDSWYDLSDHKKYDSFYQSLHYQVWDVSHSFGSGYFSLDGHEEYLLPYVKNNIGGIIGIAIREYPESNDDSDIDDSSFVSFDADYLQVNYAAVPDNLFPENGAIIPAEQSFDFSWRDTSSGPSASNYRIQLSENSDFPDDSSTIYYIIEENIFSFNPTSSLAGKCFYWRVQARNVQIDNTSRYGIDYAVSDWSPTLSFCILTSPPTGVSASDGTYTDKVLVTWDAVYGATSYTVYRRATSPGGTKTTLGSTPSTEYNDYSASVGTIYYYWVKASNTYGTSDFSAYDTGFCIGNRPPTLNPIGNQAVDGGYLLEFTITAADPDNDNLAFSATNLPPGTSLTDHGNGTATFSWQTGYGDAGIYNDVTFTVTDDGTPALSDSETITISVGDDNDGDGVPNVEEHGPQGNDPAYDGNGDGIPDSQQDNVVSFHTYDGQHYVTLACSDSIANAAAVDNPSPADSPFGVEFPYGFFEFTINGLNPGDGIAATLYLPDEANPITYYRYGPTPNDGIDHWYKFLYDAPTQTGADIIGNIITLHFVDGQRGDDDLTSDGNVIDQGGPGFSGDNYADCFIATAAHGSIIEPHVNMLREFRDRFLLVNAIGKGFVRLYNTCSPPIADFIAKHASLRAIVRVILLPVVGVSWVALKFGPISTMVLTLLLGSGLIILVAFRRKLKE